MKDAAPQTIYLKDYQAFGWNISKVELLFKLAPSATRVISRIAFSPNPDAPAQEFFLHGEELRLIRASINGQEASPKLTDRGLTCDVPQEAVLWEAEVEIAPESNTALEGL
jgi:aminopeptidase N